ncbi:MAG: hypothetical protein WCE21_05575 [Candidatus Babeliales bacterium]
MKLSKNSLILIACMAVSQLHAKTINYKFTIVNNTDIAIQVTLIADIEVAPNASIDLLNNGLIAAHQTVLFNGSSAPKTAFVSNKIRATRITIKDPNNTQAQATTVKSNIPVTDMGNNIYSFDIAAPLTITAEKLPPLLPSLIEKKII